MPPLIELIGRKFGQWEVLSRAENGAGKNTRWNCRCACGNESPVHAGHLLGGKSTKCETCNYSDYGRSDVEAVIRMQFSTYKTHAKTKLRAFELTLEQFTRLVTQACTYCGNSAKENRKGPFNVKRRKFFPLNGVDRQDNDLGYLVSNCVPCCTTCNMMKKTLSGASFIQLCKTIAANHFPLATQTGF